MLYVAQVTVSSLLPLISIPIITHKLPPSEFGVFALAQVYASIAAGIMNWGASVGYERNFFLHEHNQRESGALISSVIAFVFTNVIVMVAMVIYWKDSLSTILFDVPIYGDFLVIILAGTSLSTLASYYLTYLKNSGLASDFVKITISQSIVNFVLVLIFLLYVGAGVNSLAYALFLSNLFLFVVVLVKQIGALPVSLDKALLVDVLRISLPLTPRVFFGFINTHFDKMMLGMMASVGGVGIYSIGQKVSLVVFQFMTALDGVFKPEVYRKLFSQEQNNIDPEIGKYLTPFAYISILAALMVILFAEEVFVLLLPESYLGAVSVVIILSMFYATMFFGKIIGVQLIYAKKTHLTTVLTLIGILLNVALNIPMILLWGILGAAWATLIAGSSMTVVSYYVAQRYARVQWEWRSMFAIYGVFFTAAGFALIFHMDLLGISYESIIVTKVLVVMTYIFLGKKLDIVTIQKGRTMFNTFLGMVRRRSPAN